MHQDEKSLMNRRDFMRFASAAGAGLAAMPYINCGKLGVSRPMRRTFGRIGFETTTLGLGGQASLQWTPADVDPVKIILKAYGLGINYFDTSNLYGPSQANYGKAFRSLGLVPGLANYKEKLRQSIFITSKTHLRWSKGLPKIEGVGNWSNSDNKSAVQDLKRSLSLVFGDGNGNYPKGAYLDMILIHSVSSMADVDAVYEELENPDPAAENIGALAGLLDYRDGTNRTGLNPKEEKLVRHLGFSGHFSPAVMMEMIQRDGGNILDGMLVSINGNDKLQFNMQNNVFPVAGAKNMGIIAMKVFADGAMYDKEANWSRQPEHVVRRIGSETLPSRPLVEYSLTAPGIHTAIIGIGQISEEAKQCQLSQNLSAAQIEANSLPLDRRKEIEAMTHKAKEGKTNYFQDKARGLTAVQAAEIARVQGAPQQVKITWQTAFAGDAPIDRYEVYRGQEIIGTIAHQPQITKIPFEFLDTQADPSTPNYQVIAIDKLGEKAGTELVCAA
jgi:aryl-alcohol dehydrogenase-like predicted oxidoreductase